MQRARGTLIRAPRYPGDRRAVPRRRDESRQRRFRPRPRSSVSRPFPSISRNMTFCRHYKCSLKEKREADRNP